MEEVQAKYSRLAIELAISELNAIKDLADEKTATEINKRIEHLNGLI